MSTTARKIYGSPAWTDAPAGWIAAFIRAPAGTLVRSRVIARFADMLSAPQRPAMVAVDMPIGLPEFSPAGGRLAEAKCGRYWQCASRACFESRRAHAIYATSNTSKRLPRRRTPLPSCATARKHSEDKKAIALQAFYLCPKIRRDGKCAARPAALTARVLRMPSRTSVLAVNGERALTEPKKVKDTARAGCCAENCCRAAGIAGGTASSWAAEGRSGRRSPGCACLRRRSRGESMRGNAKPFPDPPPRDAYGLPMAIWA